MVLNSSSVPRRMFRNSGRQAMPSGSSRMTSSVTPGRMVGLIMPTTPRQLENAIYRPAVVMRCAAAGATLSFVGAVVLRGCRLRNIAFGNVALQRGAVALPRIAITAAACALQQETLAGLHLDPRRGRRLVFLLGADPYHKARPRALLAAVDSLGRKFRLVETADHGRILEQFVLAPHRKPAAPAASAARIRNE